MRAICVGYLGARAGPGAGYLSWLLGCPCGAWCWLLGLATWLSRSKPPRDYPGRQELAIFRDPRHHHPAPKLHKLKEGRQEEIMMGDKTWRFRGTPGTTKSRTSTVNCLRNNRTRRDWEGRQLGSHARDPSTPTPTHSGSPPANIGTRQKAIMKGEKFRTPADPDRRTPVPQKRRDKRQL